MVINEKNFKNKKTKTFILRALSFGILIPIVATTAVACNSNKSNKIVQNKATINVVHAINASSLNLNGTAFANFDTIINNTNNFVFKNLTKFVTGDISLIGAKDVGVANAKINPNKISISFDLIIAPQKFYINNELSQNELSQTVTINNFQPLEESDNDPAAVTLISQNNIKSLWNTYQGLIFNSGVLNLNYFPNLTTIADNAFSDSETNIFKEPLTQVIFNPNITSIGKNAFLNNKIINISIDKSSKLTSIGKDAFLNNNIPAITVANEKIKALFINANFTGTINVSSPSSNLPLNPDPIPSLTSEEFAMGGQIANTNLITSSYNLVANALDLHQEDLLSSLNNETLNANLHKKYPNLNINLANGSNEATGVLNLVLNGSYSDSSNNILITDKPMLISGFYAFKSNYALAINEASFNLNQYFANLQTQNSMVDWSTSDWLDKYLKTLEASFPLGGGSVNVLSLYHNHFLKNFSFNFTLKNEVKQNLIISAI